MFMSCILIRNLAMRKFVWWVFTLFPQAREAAGNNQRREKMGVYTRCFKSSVDDLKDPCFYRALIGELLGVLFLVFVACSSPYGDKELDNTRVSLSFGLSVATMVWLLANVSGGHINPAVTSGMFITRKVKLTTLPSTNHLCPLVRYHGLPTFL